MQSLTQLFKKLPEYLLRQRLLPRAFFPGRKMAKKQVYKQSAKKATQMATVVGELSVDEVVTKFLLS